MSISDRLDQIEDDIHNAFRLPKTPAVALVAEELAPDMLAALRAVLDLHVEIEYPFPDDDEGPIRGCSGCGGRSWPCPTVRAVEAALGEVAS